MILTVDVGNTNLTLGLFDRAGSLRVISRLATDRRMTGDQYALQISLLLTLYDFAAADLGGAILSSVVPQLKTPLIQALTLLTDKQPLVVGPGLKTGLNICIDDPAELGADIVTESVAALRKHKPPIVLVDIGTATKISAIDAKGAYLGCAILPGVRISGEALTSSAAQLSQISLDDTFRAIGKNTADSIRSGLLHGNADAINGMVARYEAEIGKATIVVTGGDAPLITPFLSCDFVHDPDLIMHGLYYLYNKNKQTDRPGTK